MNYLEIAGAGLIGAIYGIVVVIGITFIVHLVITPSRLRKEQRRKFIRDNAVIRLRKPQSRGKEGLGE